jgi:hypothetical protein
LYGGGGSGPAGGQGIIVLTYNVQSNPYLVRANFTAFF